MSEKVTDVKNKIGAHLREHKRDYVISGTCLLLGGMAGGIVMTRRPEIVAMNKIIGPAWKPVQTVIQFVERSTPSKHLHKVGTHEYYDSVSDAARKTGHDRAMISKHINGHIPDLKGDVFEVVQPAA